MALKGGRGGVTGLRELGSSAAFHGDLDLLMFDLHGPSSTLSGRWRFPPGLW